MLNLSSLPPAPVLFILQLLHSKDSIIPYRPEKYEELVEIIDMSVMLGSMRLVIDWLKHFTNPDGSSKFIGIQTGIVTLEFATSFDPPATAMDFAHASAEFIKRSSETSLGQFERTYVGACFNNTVHCRYPSLSPVTSEP
jgi:hypothetical protein